MALSSPRFTSRHEFSRIERNLSKFQKGSNGSAVQVFQQALIDLGFPLSASDGDFGINTEWSVREFQRRNHLDVDGSVGSQTLTRLDRLLPGYQHRVNIHFRSINNTRVGFGRILDSTKAIYAQYGIQIEMASGKSLLLSQEQTVKFFSISNECKWDINSGELFELQGIGGAVPTNEILVYFIKTFDSPRLLGCGGHSVNRPAATVAANASQWDTPHEIGHVLLTSSFSGATHSNKSSNLMYKYSRSRSTTPTLDNLQLVQMRRSVCCTAIH